MKAYYIIALIFVGAGLMAGSYVVGRSHEKALGSSRVASAIIEAQKKRGNVNAEIESFSTHSLCINLGGLHSECDQLRGVGENKP